MFSRIKKFLGSKEPLPHEIVQCETKVLESPNGPKFVIFLAANLYKPDALDSLIEALVERFKLYRMISPPDTSMLLVTVIGPCSASDLVGRWRDRVSGDQIAQVWMDRMEKADLAVGPTHGSITSEYYSLLSSAALFGGISLPALDQKYPPTIL